MKAARHVLLAMAALGLGGCVALNRGSIAPRARPLAERTFELDEFIADHNRNAESIKSLEAKPTIGVKGKLMKAQADGRLGMVRPRNFKLELKSMGQTKANIGSNDDEFWFWVQSDEDRSIYWCNYADLESSALAVTYQPDSIIEALGLKPITPEEADGIKIERTTDPNASALVFPPTKSRGENVQRVMIVSNYTRRIKEHRIYGSNRAGPPLFQAIVSRYKDFDLEKSDSGAFQSCYLPERLTLEWKKDQLTLDVVLQDVTINQFDESRADRIFVEPVIDGYKRVNLAEMAKAAPRDNRATARRTLPAPPPRNGVKLGRPTPVTDEGGDAPHARAPETRRAGGRIASPLEDLVKAPLPIGAEGDSTRQATAALANSENSPIER
jgi:hypothetical protein